MYYYVFMPKINKLIILIMYGLSKVYKKLVDDLPHFRLILYAFKTPAYKLVQFLFLILTSINVKVFVPSFNPLSANFTKWSNTLKQFVAKLPTNCLSVFDHFVGLALKWNISLRLRLIYEKFGCRFVIHKHSMREKYLNMKFFLVRIFLHLDWIRRFTS